MALEVEGCVVRAHRVDQAAGQAVPKNLLIRNVAQGWRHNKFGSFEVRFFGAGFVEDEILNECLDKNIHPALAGGNRLAQCFLAAEVDDVSVRAGQGGEGHQVVDALGLNVGRAAVVVRIRSGAAGREKFLLQLRNKSFILAVRGNDNTKFLGQLECLPEFGVIDAEGAFVREEDFEAADALFDDLAQLFGRVRIEARHPHVKGVVAAGFAFRLGLPRGESIRGRHVARWTDHFENRRRSADQCGLGSRLVVVLRIRAHKGQINVRMRIDEAGENVFSGCIDHFGAGGRCDGFVDSGDRLAFAKNVRGVTRVCVDNIGVFNKK